MQEFNTDLPIPDELTSLKARADLMGITYHPSIGVDKLREKVQAALENKPTGSEKEDVVVAPKSETAAERQARKRKEASALIRIRVTCMNPAKKEWDGEIITTGNSLVGTFRKYIPFNSDEGWHVPQIIYNQLVSRQCQVFTTVTDARGNKVRRGKLIREFAIEVLPQLTPQELHELAQRQAMAKSID
jgi:hypothetical protein